MSEVKKIATRESYGNALVELGKKYENLVVLDADLAGATKTGTFQKAYPERHIDCGIAESNMMGIAAGLSTTGKVPFASTFAMFAAGRAYEQVRNSIGYPHLNVKIGATHAGISVGEDGATHQCNEDMALMRTIPGMVILNPSDDVEAKAAVEAAYLHEGPVYLRFGRLAVPVINDRPDYKFEIGKGIVLREGKDVTIFATGLCVSETLAAAEKLTEDGIDAKVINIHTIKPLDEELVVKAAKETGKVVTVEEHSVIGGLGGAVAEVLSEKAPTQMLRIGINDVFGESGPAVKLLEKYGIDANPTSFSDLVRISGLSHGTDVWLGNAQDLIKSGTATITTCICTRDDIMIYLINKGLEHGQAFTIMESVRKGKGLKPDWIEEMKSHGVPDWYIESCKKIKYMFPKAHAAAYVMMGWRIAYCKIYYPLAYYAAYFSIRATAFSYELMCQGKEKLEYFMDDYEKRKDTLSKKEQDTQKDMKIVQEMYARGFEFVPIDLYKANAHTFQIIDGKLMPALDTIEGLGDRAADAVVLAAEDGEFLSKDDFRNRTKVSKTVIELMSDLGLFGDLPESNQMSLFDFQ